MGHFLGKCPASEPLVPMSRDKDGRSYIPQRKDLGDRGPGSRCSEMPGEEYSQGHLPIHKGEQTSMDTTSGERLERLGPDG